jgi:hypothetical protein
VDPVNNYARPLLSAAPQCGVNGFALSGWSRCICSPQCGTAAAFGAYRSVVYNPRLRRLACSAGTPPIPA